MVFNNNANFLIWILSLPLTVTLKYFSLNDPSPIIKPSQYHEILLSNSNCSSLLLLFFALCNFNVLFTLDLIIYNVIQIKI